MASLYHRELARCRILYGQLNYPLTEILVSTLGAKYRACLHDGAGFMDAQNVIVSFFDSEDYLICTYYGRFQNVKLPSVRAKRDYVKYPISSVRILTNYPSTLLRQFYDESSELIATKRVLGYL